MSPKAPPSRIKQGVPKLLADLIDNFLPPSISYAQRVSEKDTIFEFVKDLNKVSSEFDPIVNVYKLKSLLKATSGALTQRLLG